MMIRLLSLIHTLIALAVVIAGGAAIYGVQQFRGAGPLDERMVVVIPRGTGVSGIAALLERSGVIASAELFRIGVLIGGADRALQAGEFAFPAGVSAEQAMRILQAGRTVSYSVTIPEGLTSREVVERLRDDPVLTGAIETVPPQGALLPETYAFTRGDTRQSVLDRMRAAMDRTVAELWEDRAADLPFDTPEQAVTLASIVEKETGVAGERSLVAGVFVNRLRIDMPLQSDPTVIFALTEGQRPLGRQLLRSDWRVEHPYNTYRNRGLPPGPIANPGREAIAAALNPAETEYFYFVADGTGGHAFARTLDEHNRNVANWRRVRDR